MSEDDGYTTPGELYEEALAPEPPTYPPMVEMTLPMLREMMEWQSEKAMRMLEASGIRRHRWVSE